MDISPKDRVITQSFVTSFTTNVRGNPMSEASVYNLLTNNHFDSPPAHLSLLCLPLLAYTIRPPDPLRWGPRIIDRNDIFRLVDVIRQY